MQTRVPDEFAAWIIDTAKELGIPESEMHRRVVCAGVADMKARGIGVQR